jgi:ribokinase
MNRITVIGSLNMDMVIESPVLPKKGETIIGNGFATIPGGKGANQAVAASRLGGEVSMLGCVGQDSFGDILITNLKTNGVDVQGINSINGISTGVAVIVIHEGDNSIIVDGGANLRLSPEMINGYEEVIKSSCMVVLQMEIPMDTVKRVIDIAKTYNTKVLLNSAPAAALDSDDLKKVDILTLNETECEIITGIPINSIDDANNAAVYLFQKGVNQVVITLGEKGVVYNSGSEPIHKAVPKVKVLDTTAAGDSFTGALAVSLVKGEDIHSAIDFACKVAAITVTRKGAQTSLPYLNEIKIEKEG